MKGALSVENEAVVPVGKIGRVEVTPAEVCLPVSIASPSDYLALLKPRVMSLVMFTALTGVLIAPLHVNPAIGFASLLAIAAGAGAAGALNMWYDADIDVLMLRTQNRPSPAGRMSKQDALSFGMVLAVFSVMS
ncbi:MAG: UbiA family prenyltransferase, partial [Methylocella sp.]